MSRDNPKADWYVWAEARDDGSPPNNWLSIFGGSAWKWDPRRAQYYLHNFLVEQPDLNFHCPAVREAVLADMRFWLERGVDGLRLDAEARDVVELVDDPGQIAHAIAVRVEVAARIDLVDQRALPPLEA
jgi:hypothetical protein